MMIKKNIIFILLGFSIIICSGFLIPSDKITIHLIGDSTMADKPLDDNPERGWGQLLSNFCTEDIKIENYAVNGRSTKSFINEGRWNSVLKKIKPGDYVFIQFGHNDAKLEDSTRYAAPHTLYKQNLIKFVNETRLKNANPVLITPVNRRKYDLNGNFVDQHGDYPVVVREVAKELNVPLIDLHAKSLKLLSELGPEKTKDIFLHVEAGKYKAKPNGVEDNTHFSRYGAILIAKLVVESVKELNFPISNYMKTSFKISTESKGKVVGLDYYYNHEMKKDTDGKPYQFHYTWEDKENSGFSQFGNLIENSGAELSELHNAPSKEDLEHLSIYIIVDPDIPSENPEPSYIEDSSIVKIVDWVRDGGVLVLMGNDIGNAEFEHLNRLAGNFGIHFNEDSRNKVVDNNFDMAKFDKFPDHPLFKNISKIYVKEISTFSLNKPAVPILTEGKDTIMTSSKFGKGFVFAIGDPWLYNEYIDHRKLPKEFQNYEAGVNLMEWLLPKSKVVKKLN